MASGVRRLGPCGLLLLAALGVSAAGLVEAQGDPVRPPAVEARLAAVHLYQGGLAWQIWEAEVRGSGVVRLRVQRSALDDLLATLVPSGDALVTGISYPVRDTLERTLGSLPVDPGPGVSLSAFLAAQRGAILRATTRSATYQGRLLAVDESRQPGGSIGQGPAGYQADPAAVGAMILQTADGVRSIPLTHDLVIRFADPALNTALTSALVAIETAREDDVVPVELWVQGRPSESVVLQLAWLQEAPAWKASYRLEQRGDETQLTAFAVVDNPGAAAWEEVRLSLETGAPISFRMALSDPLTVPRPELPVPLNVPGAVPEFGADLAPSGSRGAPRPSAAARSGNFILADREMAEAAPLGALQAAAIAETDSGPLASQRYRISEPVNLPAGASALVPLALQPVTFQSRSVFDQRQDPSRPYQTVSLLNTTGLFLPAGPLSLVREGSFAGSSLLPALPAGAEALLPLAVDSDLRIIRGLGGTTTAIATATVSEGVLRVQRRQERRWTWTVESAAATDRELLIVEPVNPGWDLLETQGVEEERVVGTERRLLVVVPAGSEAFSVGTTEFRVTATETGIGAVSDAELLAIVESGVASGALSSELRAILDLRRHLSRVEQQMRELDSARSGIVSDQSRLRDNLNAVGPDSALGRRYVEQLTAQEDELTALATERVTLEQERSRLRDALSQRISRLDN